MEELVPLLLDVDTAQVVLIEEGLEASEIVLGARLSRVPGCHREVVVESVRGRARLLHDHRGEGEDGERDDGREGEIDERDRRPTRDPRLARSRARSD